MTGCRAATGRFSFVAERCAHRNFHGASGQGSMKGCQVVEAVLHSQTASLFQTQRVVGMEQALCRTRAGGPACFTQAGETGEPCPCQLTRMMRCSSSLCLFTRRLVILQVCSTACEKAGISFVVPEQVV